MAGALDLFGGTGSVSGVNGFSVDHDPLHQLQLGPNFLNEEIDALAAIAEWITNTFGELAELLLNGIIDIGAFIKHLFDLVFHFGGGIDLSSPEALLGSVVHLIEGVTQLDLTHGPDDFLTSLVELLGDWINALLAGVGVAVEDVLKIIAQVFSAPFEALAQGIAGVTDWVLDTIFGLVAPDRIPLLPIGHLMFDRVNLLTNPQFTDEAIASDFQGDWTLDKDVTHSGVGCSARIDANGKEHTLISTDLIPVHGLSVTNAQQLHVAAWVKTEDLVGPVGSVRIGLAKYRKADGSDTPTYEDLAIPTQFNDTDWREWKEDWLVEPGVVAVRFHVTVSDEALSGKIWFDDLFLGKNGLLNANWVDGLGELFENFGQLAADFAAQVWATLEDVAEAVGGAIADLIESIVGPSAFDTLEEWVSNVNGFGQAIADVVNGIGAAITEGITNFVEAVFGGFNDFNSFEEFITSVLDSLKPQAIFEAIKEFIDDLLAGVVAGFASIQHVADEISAAITGFVQSIFGGIDGFNTFEEFITHVLESLNPVAIFNSIQASISTAISNAVSGLASIGDVTAAIAAAIGNVVQDVIDWIKENLGIDFSAPFPFFNSFATGLSNVPVQLSHLDITMPGFPDVGAGVTAAIENLQETLNSWQQALTGRPPSEGQPATPEMNATQIEELLATTAANTTALTALQTAVQGGLTNMIASGDDFERTNSNGVNPTTGTPTLRAPLWQEKLTTPTGRGRFYTGNGQAFWRDEGAAENLAQYRRVDAADRHTVTAYQKITRITGTTVAESGIPLIAGPGVDYLYARVSDDFTNYLYVAFDGDGKVTLGMTTTGPAGEAAGILATATTSRPTAGTSYSIECGDAGDLRSYRVLRNNIAVLAWEDSKTSPKTAVLDNNRGWGWGGKAVPRLTGQSTPSSLHSITVADIPPEPTLGSFLHVARTSVAPVSDVSGEGLLPAGTFDDLIRNSPDLTFNLTSGILLITKPGPYTINVRLDIVDNQVSGDVWEILLYRITKATPELLFRGGQLGAPNGFLANAGTNSLQTTFSFYSAGVNQQYAIGMNSPIAERINGSADGANTWLTVTRGT